MATWSFTLAVPVGLAVRVLFSYVAVGALLIIPADRVLWSLYRRQNRRLAGTTYRAWMASKHSRWYRSGMLRWPAVVSSIVRASYRLDHRVSPR